MCLPEASRGGNGHILCVDKRTGVHYKRKRNHCKKRSEGEKPEEQLLILTFSRRQTVGLIVAINVSKHLGFSGGPH